MRLNARESYTARVLLGGAARFRTALATATVTAGFRRAGASLATAARNSALARSTDFVGRAVRASWLYRWFTAEPDPDVVVVDLRETVTVGPILLLLDRVLDPLTANWGQSRWGRLVDRLTDAFLAEPVRVVSTVVLAAVAANLALVFALGTPTPNGVGSRFVVASLALAGTRVTGSAEELAQSRTYEVLVALLEPPEPPDEER